MKLWEGNVFTDIRLFMGGVPEDLSPGHRIWVPTPLLDMEPPYCHLAVFFPFELRILLN